MVSYSCMCIIHSSLLFYTLPYYGVHTLWMLLLQDEESDEEEKKAILAEENILQLEESEKVN